MDASLILILIIALIVLLGLPALGSLIVCLVTKIFLKNKLALRRIYITVFVVFAVIISSLVVYEWNKDSERRESFYSSLHGREGIAMWHQSEYYPNGALKSEVPYEYGKPNGIGTVYFESGKIKSKTVYKVGKELSRKEYDEKGDLIFEKK